MDKCIMCGWLLFGRGVVCGPFKFPVCSEKCLERKLKQLLEVAEKLETEGLEESFPDMPPLQEDVLVAVPA